MTPRERAAYEAGIRDVLDMALIAAVTIEVRPDAQEVRQRAAIAALQGLVEGAGTMLLPKPVPSGDVIVRRQEQIVAGQSKSAPCLHLEDDVSAK